MIRQARRREPPASRRRREAGRSRTSRSRTLRALGVAICVLPWSACALAAPLRMPTDGALEGLPLIELPAPGMSPGAPLAMILSGDGGWSRPMRELARELGLRGISTVGWNSLRYYWRDRGPEEGARDLKRIVDHYRHVWRAGPVVLVGYSWGADVVPALANRLPAGVQAEVAEVVVIGFSGHENFRFYLASWLGQQVGDTYPARPELRRLSLAGVPILCINGAMEEERGCEDVFARALRVVLLPTGHHFGDFMDEIGAMVAAGAVARAPLAEPDARGNVARSGAGSGD